MSKLGGGNPVLIKGLDIVGEIPYNHKKVGKTFSIGHITGLAIEDAIVQCLLTYINGYDEEDDIVDITNRIGNQGFNISDNISIKVGRDNNPTSDFYINYIGKKYNVQIKAVKSANEGVNEMNASIRKGVDMGIVVVYDLYGNDVVIESLQLYVPDIDGTYNYISKSMRGRKKLSLDRNKSFITIGPRLRYNDDNTTRMIRKNN